MKKLIAVLLCMVVTLLAVRVWQELPVAQGGQPKLATENGDVNGDGFRDVSDPLFLLNWLFSGGPDPVAIAQDGGDMLAKRVAALEAGAPPVDGFTFVETNAQGFPEYTHDQTGILFVNVQGLCCR